MRNQRSRNHLSLLGLAFALLLGLSLAAPVAASPAKDTRTYKISKVFDASARSAIAATGVDIFEVGHDYVLVEATAREARALKRLGLKLVQFRTQEEFLKAFPAADSAYHDYAEMVAELQQAAFDHRRSSRCSASASVMRAVRSGPARSPTTSAPTRTSPRCSSPIINTPAST